MELGGRAWHTQCGGGQRQEGMEQDISWPARVTLWDAREAEGLSVGAAPYEGNPQASQKIGTAQRLKKQR